MRFRSLVVLGGLLWVALFSLRPQAVSALDEWLPITPEELKMTSDPAAPGAPAITLYRQVDRDDSETRTPHEYNYVRTKIFNEEGRKYADVEIPYVKTLYTIHNIRARTIRPDGSIVDFDGKIFDKEIVKSREIKFLAKTFTLTDVQPGSIIEYHYMIDFVEYYVFNSNWVLSDDLFTKKARFTLKPYGEWQLQWSWPNGLPEGTKPPVNEGKIIHMEAQNIPAFQTEDDMPPEGSMKFRVDFIYSEEGFEKEADKFWKRQGKKMYDFVEGFTNKRKAMEQAVAETVSASDSPEIKLQKLYARVLKLRNTSYELEKTAQEQKRAKEKEINNVEEVWKRGYGNDDQISLLYFALVRAAGIDAAMVKISRRDDHFFSRVLMRSRDLNTYTTLVKLNGKELYLDPGAAFTPFGLLPWWETGTAGLKLDKDGGTWVTTPVPESTASQVIRKADLKLTNEGALEGKLTVTYSGLEASWRRHQESHQDEASRKSFLEEDIKYSIPVGIEVELTNKPDWTAVSSEMIAEFSLKVPGWVSGAGRRALMPVGLFSASEKHICEHASRIHPLYFHYPSQKIDEVTVDLPLGWTVSSLPQAQNNDAKAVAYSLKVQDQKGTLHVARTLRRDLISLEQKYYGALRNFYQAVRTADEQQIVLQPGGSVASSN
jgi:uncharacterized protein DUF3857